MNKNYINLQSMIRKHQARKWLKRDRDIPPKPEPPANKLQEVFKIERQLPGKSTIDRNVLLAQLPQDIADWWRKRLWEAKLKEMHDLKTIHLEWAIPRYIQNHDISVMIDDVRYGR